MTDVHKLRRLEDGESTGTIQMFQPDYTVMDLNEFSFETLKARFREMASYA